jgi:polycomb group RING finger protein 4
LVLGINLPMIVDIDWRLDYSVRSRQGGAVNKPMFFVCLKVKDRGLLRNIDMIASQEELQDLHNKVRDAVKQVERVLNTI